MYLLGSVCHVNEASFMLTEENIIFLSLTWKFEIRVKLRENCKLA